MLTPRKLAQAVIGTACVAMVAHMASATAATDGAVPTAATGLMLGAPGLSAPTPGIADTWVLTIGTNDYAAAPSLGVAEADAIAVDQHLGAAGIPQDHRVRLLGQDATARNIEAAIAWLADRAQPEDQAILFIAGHATSKGATQTLHTTDGHKLEDTKLAALLQPVEAELWIIMATCHGGGFTELLTPTRTLTAAAETDQLSYENLDLGYSYLVEYLFNRNLDHTAKTINVTDLFTNGTEDLDQDHPDRLPIQTGSGQMTIATRWTSGEDRIVR